MRFVELKFEKFCKVIKIYFIEKILDLLEKVLEIHGKVLDFYIQQIVGMGVEKLEKKFLQP